MYVITFYSFKGGVGRTLALVNVAHNSRCRANPCFLLTSTWKRRALTHFPHCTRTETFQV